MRAGSQEPKTEGVLSYAVAPVRGPETAVDGRQRPREVKVWAEDGRAG